MSTPHDPHEAARLRALLDEAAEGVTPGDGLADIRRRTARGGHARRRTPAPWWYAVGGAVAATVLVAVGISVVGGPGDRDDPVADDPSSTESMGIASGSGSPTPSGTTPAPSGEAVQMPVYYVVDGPRWAALVAAPETLLVEGDAIGRAAVQQALDGPPSDPDYRTVWPAGTTADVAYQGNESSGTWTVELTNDDVDLGAVPDGWTDREVDVALWQLAYTLRATTRSTTATGVPADFTVEVAGADGSGQLLGRPDGEVAFPEFETQALHLVNIDGPSEGRAVAEDVLQVNGVASSPENNVPWELRRDGEVVLSGFATAEGDVTTNALLPWSTEIDVSGLEPGSYELVAMTEDASGGEGAGPSEDTRTVVVE